MGLCHLGNMRHCGTPALRRQPVSACGVCWSFLVFPEKLNLSFENILILRISPVKTLSVCTDSWKIVQMQIIWEQVLENRPCKF